MSNEHRGTGPGVPLDLGALLTAIGADGPDPVELATLEQLEPPVGRDDFVLSLIAEVQRLRAGTGVDRDAVERAARAIAASDENDVFDPVYEDDLPESYAAGREVYRERARAALASSAEQGAEPARCEAEAIDRCLLPAGHELPHEDRVGQFAPAPASTGSEEAAPDAVEVETPDPLIDPDCRDPFKHRSCAGGPCECPCHQHDETPPEHYETEWTR